MALKAGEGSQVLRDNHAHTSFSRERTGGAIVGAGVGITRSTSPKYVESYRYQKLK